MLPQERKQFILTELDKYKKVDIDELVTQLDVSAMTVRRDLTSLEEEEKIIRTHGGAILNKPLIAESSFQTKQSKKTQEKKQIAQLAMGYIHDTATVILDSGTTTFEIARLLKHKPGVTVITNDIKIAAELMDSEAKVIVAGGGLQKDVGALFGPVTEQMMKNVHVDLFFLGAHAVHLDAGVTAPSHEKSSIKRIMLEAADKTWLVADASKFDNKSLVKVCSFSSIDGLITDERLSESYEKELREYIDIQVAEGREVQ